MTRAFAGAGAAVNLLTHVPPVERMLMPGAWKENDRLRREASAVIARVAAAAAVAVAAAIEAPPGVYDVVDDDPPIRAEVEAALAAAVGREKLRAPLPPLAKVVPIMRVLARSLRPSNQRLREATVWALRVRSGVEGWRLAANAPPER